MVFSLFLKVASTGIKHGVSLFLKVASTFLFIMG